MALMIRTKMNLLGVRRFFTRATLATRLHSNLLRWRTRVCYTATARDVCCTRERRSFVVSSTSSEVMLFMDPRSLPSAKKSDLFISPKLYGFRRVPLLIHGFISLVCSRVPGKPSLFWNPEMEPCLYSVLGVARTASEDEIKRAYKKLAMAYHPDRNTGKSEQFQQVAGAYEVLSDSHRRSLYDQFGITTFTEPVHQPPPWFMHQAAQQQRSQPSNQQENSKRFDTNIIQKELVCSLEELFTGCVRSMKVQTSIVDATGKKRTRENRITIPVKPGWKKNTKITFADPETMAPSIVFVVVEKPHERFSREEDDLVATVDLTLKEALCGTTVALTHLDGREISYRLTDPVGHGDERRIGGEGMPISKLENARGDLVLRFRIAFPSTLTEAQRAVLRDIL
eukprot:c16605_g1_i3.p1 GENE.c16605_g1_i3~~c16605_g1_i3.p1  ORF type:complete len:397 (+),score=56.75 c16605_g1_i3:595-1785(+)